MSYSKKSKAKKFVAGFVGIATALTLSLGGVVTPAQAVTVEELTAQISSLLTTIASLQSQLSSLQGGSTGGTTTGTGYTFSTNLKLGDSSEAVKQLQIVLNQDSATQVAESGVGSKGNETMYFGGLTKAAVIKFQNKYASEVLAPVGLSAGTGFVGASTRAKLNMMTAVTGGTTTGGTTTGGTTTGGTTTGGGLTVSSPVQPTASLAPNSAARIPFTKVTLTAGSTDVTVDNFTVERTGLAADAAFSGVVLLDENGVQIGTSKTFNSNHQSNVGDPVVIKAGQSRTFTIGGNMVADNSTRAGQVASIAIVGINTSATVSGSLPITGAAHTINASLSVGTASLNVSSFDPNSAQTKEIGTTGVRIAGIRVTAGSAEDIRIRNIRWNQTGSAGSGDISNVVTVADGVEYPTTVSSDGKYYTSNFGSGIVLAKGNNADIYIKVDVVGGSNRTVIMDIDKNTDLYITGELYGYGITASAATTGEAATTSSVFTTGTPFFDNATMTISAGSASTIQKSASVASQNIAVNVPNQPLGAFETDIKGESINISGLSLSVATTTGTHTSGDTLLDSVTIVDQNGSVVAGPVDATDSTTTDGAQEVVFTDSMTLPIGKNTYTIKGKVPSGTGNGTTYVVTVTPSGWTSPTGNTTGDSITISQGAFALNTMTVKAAALAISVSQNPVAQNITAGTQNFTFANYQFDASQSGEDVRFSSIPLLVTFTGLTISEITSCQLFDGSTPLNTGSNVVEPSTTSGSSETFTFDTSLTIAKGTVKTLALKCNLASTVSDGETVKWGIAASPSITVTGVTSSGSVTETVTSSTGQLMTAASGSLVASEDSSSPAYAIVKSGSTAVTNGIINFRASNEDITLQRVGLTLTNTASSSSSDIVQVTLWDGATQVGSAVFTGTNTHATSTLDTSVVIAKDTDKDITVKVDLRSVGTSDSGTQGALIAVDIDTNNTNTQGVGSSGSTINASGSTSFNGTRMFSSYPTIVKQSVPTSVLTNGIMDLYRFSIKSSEGGNGIGLHQLTLNLSTSTASAVSGTTTVTLVDVYAYTDANYSSPVPGFTNGKVITQLASLAGSGDNDAQLSSVLQIPAGSTYYFRVTGTVTLTAGTGTFSGSVTTRLGGDSTYPSLAATMGIQSDVDGNANGDNLVWSPNATTSSAAAHVDWTNGFNISGLPSDGSEVVTLSK